MREFYNRDGKPIDLMEWARERQEDNHIGDTTVDGVRVSTVWLGLDHGYGPGPPLIFETMIFGGPHDNFCERYSTKEQAQAGHDRIVTALREGRDPEDDPPAVPPTEDAILTR
jgi:hypothetical protein